MEEAKLTDDEKQYVLFLKAWHRDIHVLGNVKPADIAFCQAEEQANVAKAHSGKE